MTSHSSFHSNQGTTSFRYLYFNSGFGFVRSLVITSFPHSGHLPASRSDQSPHSAVSSPTSSILSLQNFVSTLFLFYYLQNVTLILSAFSRVFLMCYLYISAYGGVLLLASVGTSVNRFLPPVSRPRFFSIIQISFYCKCFFNNLFFLII